MVWLVGSIWGLILFLMCTYGGATVRVHMRSVQTETKRTGKAMDPSRKCQKTRRSRMELFVWSMGKKKEERW